MSLFSKNAFKSVETITAKLADTVRELEAHAEAQLNNAQVKKAEAAAARLAHEAYVAEHELATKVAGNIKKLLGV